jgi:hypothetical protein
VVGSTAFYASRGDPAAFVEIKRHFDEVFAIVVAERGAVVKTIGDAVMAAFGDPVDAVRAAQRIHCAFHPGRADSPIRLRVSLNTGPCIAVRLNANADFFGGTVNVAAKLQALAEAYQVAMSLATYDAPGVAAYLAEQAAQLDALEYRSEALPTPVAVRRWTLFTDPGRPGVGAGAPAARGAGAGAPAARGAGAGAPAAGDPAARAPAAIGPSASDGVASAPGPGALGAGAARAPSGPAPAPAQPARPPR